MPLPPSTSPQQNPMHRKDVMGAMPPGAGLGHTPTLQQQQAQQQRRSSPVLQPTHPDASTVRPGDGLQAAGAHFTPDFLSNGSATEKRDSAGPGRPPVAQREVWDAAAVLQDFGAPAPHSAAASTWHGLAWDAAAPSQPPPRGFGTPMQQAQQPAQAQAAAQAQALLQQRTTIPRAPSMRKDPS